MFDQLMKQQVKVVYTDEGQTKVVKGLLEGYEKDILNVKCNLSNSPVFIHIANLVSCKRWDG